MIPYKIHYCWFGGGPKPADVLKCIESWKKHCPDFEIIEWNETNYDIHKHPYMEQAYSDKRWGFVPDYARLDIIYEYGGIYLDTDVEVIKDLSPLCENKAFKGFENAEYVNDGQGFGAEAGLPLLKELIACYDGDEPYEYLDGKRQYIESPRLCTKVLLRHGLKQDGSRQNIAGVEIYPVDFFCPKNYMTGKLKITENTYSIHYFDGSWKIGKTTKYYLELMRVLNRIFGEKRGHRIFVKLMSIKDDLKKVIKK